MHRFHKLFENIYGTGNFLLSGALILSLFQIPSESCHFIASSVKPGTIEKLMESTVSPLAESFFGSEANLKSTQEAINRQMYFVSSRKAYSASLAVIKKHEKTIREKAKKYGVPEDVAIGIGLLENGGSETAKSPAGALGVFQLMPGTARSLGLTVNSKVDERRNAEKNIDAGMRYLALNYYRFGDWGLATWAYHAGGETLPKLFSYTPNR